MKVKPFSKALWKEYYQFLSVISVIASLVFLFVEIPQGKRFLLFYLVLTLLLIRFIVLWVNANRMSRITLSLNNSNVEIEVGNIFEEEGLKIIAFNEFYDTEVSDNLVSRNTLNGKYIERFYPDSTILDTIISKDRHGASCIVETRCERMGKSCKYQLGTIIKNGKFFLLAFTHFDKDNRAYLNIDQFVVCLMNMWNECDILYGGNTIILPLLGAGITRFHGNENISEQELLEIIIWTFKMSRIRFQYPAKVKIVLTEKSLAKINLFEIKRRFIV